MPTLEEINVKVDRDPGDVVRLIILFISTIFHYMNDYLFVSPGSEKDSLLSYDVIVWKKVSSSILFLGRGADYFGRN